MSKVKLEEDTDVLTVNRKYAASYTKKKQHEERSIRELVETGVKV